jgi:hypothetical protein
MFDTNDSMQVQAQRVPGHLQLTILPKRFGRNALIVEDAVYKWMHTLCLNYLDTYWDLYELSNGGFFMAPIINYDLEVHVAGAGYCEWLSSQAAGIIACLFTFQHLDMQAPDEVISNHYRWLREFAPVHPEGDAIIGAIDC